MQSNTNEWEKEFDEQFGEEHERITKCNCSGEEEHEAVYRYISKLDDIKSFISSLLFKQKQEIVGEIEKKIDRLDRYSVTTKPLREEFWAFNEKSVFEVLKSVITTQHEK